MPTMKCQTCGGTYEDVQRDGMRYYHACPPVWDDKAERYVEREQKRDENVVVTGRTPDGTAITSPKAAGKGVSPA